MNKKFFLFVCFFLFSIRIVAISDTLCTVDRIIDGDTFVCGGEKVRLIGVDCPETHNNPRARKQRNLGDIETIIALGKESEEFVRSLLKLGPQVRLEFDVQERDKYGRLLAYVWLSDGRMLNEVLLKEGYAMLLTIPPNVKYVGRFQKALEQAKRNKKGLWR